MTQDTPFETLPYCHPDYLGVGGSLAGLDVASPTSCRVLEIACGDGANLVPVAFHLPESEFVGIEAASSPRRAALAAREKLGLKNLEVIEGDLTGRGLLAGSFDYIIVNDIFSYVSEEVRVSLLRLCQRLLARNGVGFVGYNVRAAWGPRAMLRDLLLRSTEAAGSADEKIRSARHLLEVMDAEGLDLKNPFIGIAKFEVDFARRADDRVLHKLFLTQDNREFTFLEFASLVGRSGLAVFDEVRNPYGFAGPVMAARQRLQANLGDFAAAEACLEFLTCPSYRAPLLCHAERPSQARSDHLAFVKRWEFAAPLETRNPEILLDEGIEVPFKAAGGQLVSAKEPIKKALLAVLLEAWPQGLLFDSLLERIGQKLAGARAQRPTLSEAEVVSLANELVALSKVGVVLVRSKKHWPEGWSRERPRAFAVNSWQASRGYLLTNCHHTLVKIDELGRAMVPLLDGTRDRLEIASELRKRFDRGELVVSQAEGDARDVLAGIPAMVDSIIEQYGKVGLLEGTSS